MSWDSSQPRDDRGRWTSTGAVGPSHSQAADAHKKAADAHREAHASWEQPLNHGRDAQSLYSQTATATKKAHTESEKAFGITDKTKESRTDYKAVSESAYRASVSARYGADGETIRKGHQRAAEQHDRAYNYHQKMAKVQQINKESKR
jgi:hypothetical protein